MDADIFISFPGKDRKVASTICAALESRGFTCWISSRDILPGENFQVAIVQAIRKAKVMLLVFTANSNQSEEMSKELALASQQRLPVIPLRVEDVTPNDAFAYEFATRQWIDFFADWEYAINQLAAQIGKIIQPIPPAAPAPAPQPPAAKATAARKTAAPKAPAPAPGPVIAPEPSELDLVPVIDTTHDAPAYLEPRPTDEADSPADGDAEPRKGLPMPLLIAASVGAVLVLGAVVFAMTGNKGDAKTAAKPAAAQAAAPSPAASSPPVAAAPAVTDPAAPPADAVTAATPTAATPVKAARKPVAKKQHAPLRATRSDVPY